MQCFVTKDKISKMLTTNPQGIATFFRSLSKQNFFKRHKDSKSAADQLEHLRLNYAKITVQLENKEDLTQTNRATYRMYSDISKLYQTALVTNKIVATQSENNPLANSSQEALTKAYLKETKTLRNWILSYSEFELDHKTLAQQHLGQLSIRETVFFLLHHDKHHVTDLQTALKN